MYKQKKISRALNYTSDSLIFCWHIRKANMFLLWPTLLAGKWLEHVLYVYRRSDLSQTTTMLSTAQTNTERVPKDDRIFLVPMLVKVKTSLFLYVTTKNNDLAV